MPEDGPTLRSARSSAPHALRAAVNARADTGWGRGKGPDMADQEDKGAEGGAQMPAKDGAKGDEPKTFTQEEVNRLVAAEKARFKGYSDFKAKAEKYDELQKAQQTDAERAAELERERDRLLAERNAEAWRREASKATGVPADLLRGATKEDVEAHAELLKPYFAKDAAPNIESDGFAPAPGSERSGKDLFASAIDDLL